MLVEILDCHVDVLTALLAGDPDGYERAQLVTAESGSVDGCAALIAGAFVELTQRRFRGIAVPSGVIKYVAEIRADVGADIDELREMDPRHLEQMIFAALGLPSTIDQADEEIRANVQVALLMVLFHRSDHGLDVEDLTAAARQRALELVR